MGNSIRKPVFNSSKVTVIFVLGGPGAGTHYPMHTIPEYSFDLQAKERNAPILSRNMDSVISLVLRI